MTDHIPHDTIVLDTGLLEDRDTLQAALAAMKISKSRTLTPATMNDSDWDEVLDLVLSAKRVITL